MPPPLPTDFDTRYLPIDAADLEVRAAANGAGATLVGYAVLWGQLSEDLGGFFERFESGAFLEVIGTDVCCLVDHDMGRIVGRTLAKTLRLQEDDRGLRYEVDLPDTSIARDLAENIRLGNIRGSSFAFRVPPEGERIERIDGKLVRTVTKVVRLRDVGPTTFPAYANGSNVAVRSVEAYLEEESTRAAAAALVATVEDLDLRRRLLALLELDVDVVPTSPTRQTPS